MSGRSSFLAQLLFPHHCYLCNRIIYPRQRLCPDCADHAPVVLPPVCDLCGRGKSLCTCGGHRHAFERCVTPYYHKDVAKTGVATLKIHGYRLTVEGFTSAMTEVVRREYGGLPFGLITAVPLHPREQRKRGFDQGALLAQALAAQLGIPYVPVLKKMLPTRPQKELKALERSGNLLGVFEVSAPEWVKDRTILLVDDVITTGATLHECAKMLKIYGAVEVYAVTAAGALLQKSENPV